MFEIIGATRAYRAVSRGNGSSPNSGAGRATQDQESAGLGREPEVGDSARCQQQQLLADVQNPGHQSGRFQRVAKGERFGQCERPVVQGTRLHGKEEESFAERADLLNR